MWPWLVARLGPDGDDQGGCEMGLRGTGGLAVNEKEMFVHTDFCRAHGALTGLAVNKKGMFVHGGPALNNRC